MIIAVIGGGEAGDKALAQAEVVGLELARRGCMLICGGLGGVMEAACRGARQAGGITIGVLPGSDKSEMNPHVQLPIVTGVGRARNLIIVLTADAVIAVDGGFGTLSEIGFALAHNKPVVGLSTWTIAADDLDDIPIHRTDDPVAAVELATALAAGSSNAAEPLQGAQDGR